MSDFERGFVEELEKLSKAKFRASQDILKSMKLRARVQEMAPKAGKKKPVQKLVLTTPTFKSPEKLKAEKAKRLKIKPLPRKK
jgi:hypothetical protein